MNEFINNELACCICGDIHDSLKCTFLEVKSHVPDKVIPSKARLSLPETLKIENMADGYPGVITTCSIKKGTQFGPFAARKLFTLKPDIHFPLKIFSTDSEDFSEYYLDTSDENECNWLYFVSPASNEDEQNLICYQDKQQIYYLSLKDIPKGELLKVWYGPYYAKRMNKNVLKQRNNEESDNIENIDFGKLLVKQQNIVERENWICKFCDAVESNIIEFSKHILEHYKLQLRKVCEICRAAFGTRKGLKKHLKIVHSAAFVTPSESKNTVQKVTKQTETKCVKDSVIGGPLLSDILTDSLDNTSMLLSHTELSSFDLNCVGNQSMLLETENLSVDNLFNENVKELDHFNFEIDENAEKFVCDICLKAFTKLQFLVQHLKKHTGKFACPRCLKIFCRNENLKSHTCINAKPCDFKCSLCPKTYSQNKYLSRHINAIHKKKFKCKTCGRYYHSSKEQNEHNCSGIPDSEKQTFCCMTCNKTFLRDVYLKIHMKTHSEVTKTSDKPKMSFVCEVCAHKFDSKKSLDVHLKTHQAPLFSCHICDKKFHRKYVLENHVQTHGEPQYQCRVCNKTFKLKKCLEIHRKEHSNNKKIKCPSTRPNFTKHRTSIHGKVCPVCKKEFPTAELRNKHAFEHISSYYSCEFCDVIVRLKSSLLRHMKRKHSLEDIDPSKIVAHSGNKDLNESVPSVSNKVNTVYDYGNQNLSSEFENFNFDLNKSRGSESVLDFNDLEIDLGTDFGLQQTATNDDICLSMPNLGAEQDLALGHNTFIFENQSDQVQQQGKVVLYVVDEKFL